MPVQLKVNSKKKRGGGKAHVINMWSIRATAVPVYYAAYYGGVKGRICSLLMIFFFCLPTDPNFWQQ